MIVMWHNIFYMAHKAQLQLICTSSLVVELFCDLNRQLYHYIYAVLADKL